MQAVLDLPRLSAALAELTDSDASLVVRRVTTDAPRRRPLTELGFELGSSGVVCALSLEPELALNALGRVLRRPILLSAHGALDDSLTGALSALVLEVARRAGAQGALHLLETSEALANASDVFVEATALVAGTAYQVVLGLGLPELEARAPSSLSTLGELSIAVPVVIGLGLAERSALTASAVFAAHEIAAR